ncbi:hypothetical protein L218DRAFT_1001937 [Marasmius fiardii PR-910]|nr:hypothetical protein L218DRAFT_1001937 [Marasmius fiardii PR-910]
MNSPDQGSPLSSPSSGSQTPEETLLSPSSSSNTANVLNAVTSNLSSQGQGVGGASGKRRMHFGAGGSNRDVKTRRREDYHRKGGGSGLGPSGGGAHGGGSEMWEGKGGHGGKKDKEDLLDHHVVEYLKKEIGDPFLEATFGLPR